MALFLARSRFSDRFPKNQVKTINTGAFASYVPQPGLQALLVPVGGISGVRVLEFLANLR
jgi:hypothetical protein